MPADLLMITLAGTGAWFLTVALFADLLGLRITCSLAVGLAGWCWISAGEIALSPHESRPVIATHSPGQAAGKRFFNRYYERTAP